MTDPEKSKSNVVLSESLQHPLTLFPTAVGVLGSFSTLLFGASTITTGIALGGITIGVGSWAINYFFRRHTFLDAHMRKLHEVTETRRLELIKDLVQSLKNTQFPGDHDGYCVQARDQFKHIAESFETFKSVLVDKLNPGELTFARFLASGEQVNLAVLDNLQNIVTRLKGIKAIDPEYIDERRKALSRLKVPAPADVDELETLNQRAKLREAQLSKVNELLTFNEQALTKIAHVNSALIDMRGKGGQASLDLVTATAELEEVAQRAKKL